MSHQYYRGFAWTSCNENNKIDSNFSLLCNALKTVGYAKYTNGIIQLFLKTLRTYLLDLANKLVLSYLESVKQKAEEKKMKIKYRFY